mmetsp:Transcript_21921/g.63766  ORF Transcript_21921/g.63766 Transcript_21921/m.63766 type:complete len:302 (-) Transcript_21921:5-910(-)
MAVVNHARRPPLTPPLPPEALCNLIRRMLETDYHLRPTASEVLRILATKVYPVQATFEFPECGQRPSPEELEIIHEAKRRRANPAEDPVIASGTPQEVTTLPTPLAASTEAGDRGAHPTSRHASAQGTTSATPCRARDEQPVATGELTTGTGNQDSIQRPPSPRPSHRHAVLPTADPGDDRHPPGHRNLFGPPGNSNPRADGDTVELPRRRDSSPATERHPGDLLQTPPPADGDTTELPLPRLEGEQEQGEGPTHVLQTRAAPSPNQNHHVISGAGTTGSPRTIIAGDAHGDTTELPQRRE